MAKRKITFLIVLLALLIISTVCFSIAKYIDRQEKQNLAISDNFFFCLDIDDNSESDTPYYLVENKININVTNSDGLNVNKTNIAYSVIIENSDGVDITALLTITGNDGELTGGVISTDIISISNITTNTLYVVKISSTTPYTKTLTAKFMFRDIDNTFYTITDYDSYITLNLFVGNILPTSNLTINYGTNLAPDNTINIMRDWVNTTNGIISNTSLKQNSTYALIFFKQNVSGIYTTASTPLNLTSSQTITITPV